MLVSPRKYVDYSLIYSLEYQKIYEFSTGNNPVFWDKTACASKKVTNDTLCGKMGRVSDYAP